MRKRSLFVLIAILLLTACQRAAPTSTPTAAATTAAPTVPQAEAVATQVTPQATTTVPEPGEETGVVKGRLYSTNMEAPLSHIGVYLGEYMYLTPGPDYLVTLRQEGSPHTVSDEGGNFVISDVRPGEYPLIAWTPFTSYVIPGEDGVKEMVVTVQAGEVVDLGEIQVAWP